MQDYAITGALRLSYFLKDKINEEAFCRYARVLNYNVTRKMLYLATKNECTYDRYETDIVKKRYKTIFEPCKKNKIALICVELAILEYIDNTVNEVFKIISGNNDRGISLDIAVKIAYPEKQSVYLTGEIEEAKKIVEKILILEEIYPDYIRNTYRMDMTLLHYLNGVKESEICNEMDISGSCSVGRQLSKNFGQVLSFYSYLSGDEDFILYREKINDICRWVKKITSENELCPVVHIIGQRQTGKEFIVKQIAKELQHNLLVYEYEDISNGEELIRIIQKIKRNLHILQGALCIRVPEQYETSEKKLKIKNNILKIIRGVDLKKNIENYEVYIISGKKFKLIPYVDNTVCSFEIKKMNEIQSKKVWEYFLCNMLGSDAAKKLDISELAVKMNISIGYIKKIVLQLKYSGKQLRDNNRYISRICYQVLNDGKYDDIKHIESSYQWEDLKMDEVQKNKILDIYSQVKYKLKVYHEYGLEQQHQYGRCVSALFSGPSGTGKTMAVHVLANMLNLELYKVDLSKVVDKYIGETEKRLEEIFQKAEQSNMILFFDEADALFGKRSEVHDARDKYANTEVAYILQRIEEFDGVVILASNYRDNIDAAFMRRIKFEVRFSIPTKEIRYDIWNSAFGTKLPMEDIDLEYLSENFEFTGATIKNVALNAVFYAVSREEPLSMEHIIRAITLEYEKNGKMIFKEEFGRYGYLIRN